MIIVLHSRTIRHLKVFFLIFQPHVDHSITETYEYLPFSDELELRAYQ